MHTFLLYFNLLIFFEFIYIKSFNFFFNSHKLLIPLVPNFDPIHHILHSPPFDHSPKFSISFIYFTYFLNDIFLLPLMLLKSSLFQTLMSFLALLVSLKIQYFIFIYIFLSNSYKLIPNSYKALLSILSMAHK